MNSNRIVAAVILASLQLLIYTDGALANDDGRAIYQSICSACHAPENVMVSSPKAGDTAEWSRRLSKGLEALTDNAVKGFAAMPPKGGASALTREQVRQAIEYMVAPRK